MTSILNVFLKITFNFHEYYKFVSDVNGQRFRTIP